MSQLSPSTIKICAKAEHHTTCINAPAKNFYSLHFGKVEGKKRWKQKVVFYQ